MKKNRLSHSTVMLTSLAASLLLLFIAAITNSNASRQALAAQPKRAAPKPNQTESPNVQAAKIVEVFPGTWEIGQADGWVIEYADAPHLPGSTDHSLRVDANGNAHTVYGGDHLYYAWENGDSWQVMTVDDDPTVGLHASLDLDPNGYPHISYYDAPNHALKYAFQDKGGWHIMVVDPEVQNYYGSPIDTSIAVDAQGYPHISYCSLMSGYRSDLKYAFQDQDGWHFELVESGNEGQEHSLALDNHGFPYISYTHDEEYYGEGDRLKFAYKNAEGWQYEIIDNYNKGKDNSLVVDKNGNAHLSYGISYNTNLVYGYWDTTGWYTRTLESEGFVGAFSSIDVDANNYPHISYSGGYGILKYAHADPSRWYTTTLDIGEQPVGQTSIAIDQDNHPHIRFVDDGKVTLEHGYFDGSSWQSETIDAHLGSAGEFSSLVLDHAGFPHISYENNTNLKYAYRESEGWRSEIVTKEGKPSYISMAMDGEGYFHISYADDTTDSLNYAYQDSEGWHTQIVNVFTGPPDFGFYKYGTVYDTSLSLDQEGKAHVSYYVVAEEYLFDKTVHELHYTSGTSSTDIWPWETFRREYNQETDGSHTSLALDNAGNPHISFYLGSEDELRYAYKHQVGEDLVWTWDIVDEDGDVGTFTSIELDQDEHAHISYYDKENEDLKYASLGTSGWVTQTVDSEGMVGRYTSLDLDNTGYPHISYYDETNADLKYAYHDGSTWHAITVDSEGDVGQFTSLYLDTKGFPHISYYDESNQDLKYAYYTDVLPTQTPAPTTTPPTPEPGDRMKLFLPLTLRE